MSPILELQGMQSVKVILAAPRVVVPRDDVDNRFRGVDNRGAEYPPLVVGAPHINLSHTRPRSPEPCCPERSGTEVRSSVLLICIIQIDGVVHGSDQHSIKG